MARPIKQGLEYYNIDTDVFQNRKIRRLLKSFGSRGYLIYSYILTEIYRDKGYFIVWDSSTAFDVSDFINEKESLVVEVVNFCCSVGLFDKVLLTNESILTSKNIQLFWIDVSKKAKRNIYMPEQNYNLVKEETTLNTEETTSKQEETTPKQEESTQSKVNKSKVNKSKEEEIKENKKENEEEEKPTRFLPPTQIEVYNFFLEKKLTGPLAKMESEKFINFYDSKDWKIGKNKMAKWRSAAAGWINRMNDFNGKFNNQTTTQISVNR